MKKKIHTPSPAPFYGVAVLWLVWCVTLPLYRLWHLALLILVSLAVGFGLNKLFPGKTVEKEVEPEPVTTGDPQVDALVREGDMAVRELKRLRESIRDLAVRKRIGEITELTEKIFADLLQDPSDAPQIKRFAGYYLPTTMKLLNAYDRMQDQSQGENVSGTLRRIEDILDTTVQAYRKQYDALFANEALDIETDITVLEGMLKREGLAGSDFKTQSE